jgi:nicotinamide mononucleotide adenylyltransferase
MILESFKPDIPYSVQAIPDFGDDDLWRGFIVENIDFDVVYTNSDNESRIFTGAGVAVERIPFFDRDVYSATNVREHMSSNDSWTSLVPSGTVVVVEKLQGISRIRALSQSMGEQ